MIHTKCASPNRTAPNGAFDWDGCTHIERSQFATIR